MQFSPLKAFSHFENHLKYPQWPIDATVFFYQGFLSWTMMIHRTAWEERGPSFLHIPLQSVCKYSHIYLHFPLEMTTTYFLSHYMQLPRWYLMRFNEIWKLAFDLILIEVFAREFIVVICHIQVADLNSHRLSL